MRRVFYWPNGNMLILLLLIVLLLFNTNVSNINTTTMTSITAVPKGGREGKIFNEFLGVKVNWIWTRRLYAGCQNGVTIIS